MDTVSITKQEAASRQLDVAIQLLFAGGDVVGVHTLAGAASAIASALMEHERPEQSRELAAREVCGLDENTYREVMRKTQSFIKHANNAPRDTHEFAVPIRCLCSNWPCSISAS